MKRAIIILLALCQPALCVWAQEFALQGRVVDAETGEPLPYVNIRASEGKATLTNVEGEFKFQVEAEEIVTFSFVGYRKLSQKAEQASGTIRLKPYTTQM